MLRMSNQRIHDDRDGFHSAVRRPYLARSCSGRLNAPALWKNCFFGFEKIEDQEPSRLSVGIGRMGGGDQAPRGSQPSTVVSH